MKSFVLVLMLVNCCAVSAEELLCDVVSSRGEGHWPIRETEFTKERAKEALALLAEWASQLPSGMDFVQVENELLFVKGFLLRASIVPDNQFSLDDFCMFIEQEAYVRH